MFTESEMLLIARVLVAILLAEVGLARVLVAILLAEVVFLVILGPIMTLVEMLSRKK